MLDLAARIGPSFYPALIGAGGAILAALIGWENRRKLKQNEKAVDVIQVNVDGRMSEALEKIAKLERALGIADTKTEVAEAATARAENARDRRRGDQTS